MLALLPSLALARLWLECSHLPILEPPGTWTGGWSPPYLTLPAARLLCLVFGASQHPRRQRVPALWGDLAWCDPKPLPRFPRGRSGVWACWTPWQRALLGSGALHPWVLAARSPRPPCRHFPAHLRGKGVGGEEAAAGSRQELRLGVGRGLLCWELSSGSHQQGGREGGSRLPGATHAGRPAGTQPASPQPPSPTWGSPGPGWALGSVAGPSGTRRLQQGRCLASTSPKIWTQGWRNPPTCFGDSSSAAIVPSVSPIPLVAWNITAKQGGMQ